MWTVNLDENITPTFSLDGSLMGEGTPFHPSMIQSLRREIEKLMGFYRVGFIDFYDSYNGHQGFDNQTTMEPGWTDSVPVDLSSNSYYDINGWLKCMNEWNPNCPGYLNELGGPCLFYEPGSFQQCFCQYTEPILGWDEPFLLKATYITQIYDALDYFIDRLRADIVPSWTPVIPQWKPPASLSDFGEELPGADFSPDKALRVSHIKKPIQVIKELVGKYLQLLADSSISISHSLVSFSQLLNNVIVGIRADLNLPALPTSAELKQKFDLLLKPFDVGAEADVVAELTRKAELSAELLANINTLIAKIDELSSGVDVNVKHDLLSTTAAFLAEASTAISGFLKLKEGAEMLAKVATSSNLTKPTPMGGTAPLSTLSSLIKLSSYPESVVSIMVSASLLEKLHLPASVVARLHYSLNSLSELSSETKVAIKNYLFKVVQLQAIASLASKYKLSLEKLYASAGIKFESLLTTDLLTAESLVLQQAFIYGEPDIPYASIHAAFRSELQKKQELIIDLHTDINFSLLRAVHTGSLPAQATIITVEDIIQEMPLQEVVTTFNLASSLIRLLEINAISRVSVEHALTTESKPVVDALVKLLDDLKTAKEPVSQAILKLLSGSLLSKPETLVEALAMIQTELQRGDVNIVGISSAEVTIEPSGLKVSD